MTKTVAFATMTILALAVSGCSWADKQIHGSRKSEATMATTPPAPMAPDTVKQVQSKLHDANFYHGPVDGVWGKGTKAALHDFQVKHDIAPSGELDRPTLDALDLH